MVRRFVDARGTEWEVWEVGKRRTLADVASRRSARRPDESCWLCFASATQRRRLARYPPWWHALRPVELDRLCAAAEIEPVRPPPPSPGPDRPLRG